LKIEEGGEETPQTTRIGRMGKLRQILKGDTGPTEGQETKGDTTGEKRVELLLNSARKKRMAKKNKKERGTEMGGG